MDVIVINATKQDVRPWLETVFRKDWQRINNVLTTEGLCRYPAGNGELIVEHRGGFDLCITVWGDAPSNPFEEFTFSSSKGIDSNFYRHFKEN